MLIKICLNRIFLKPKNFKTFLVFDFIKKANKNMDRQKSSPTCMTILRTYPPHSLFKKSNTPKAESILIVANKTTIGR